jgi:hypothetical protein
MSGLRALHALTVEGGASSFFEPLVTNEEKFLIFRAICGGSREGHKELPQQKRRTVEQHPNSKF